MNNVEDGILYWRLVVCFVISSYVPRGLIPPSQWNALLAQSAHHWTITMQSSVNTTLSPKLPLQWCLVTKFLLFNLHYLNMSSAANMLPWVQQFHMNVWVDIVPLNGYQKSESFSRVLLSWHDVHKYRCSIGLKMMAMLWLSILFPSWMGLTPLDSWYVERQLSLTCANILLAWSSSLALICINWST